MTNDDERPTFDAALGERVRELRQARQETADDIARNMEMNGARWDRSTVSRVERGVRGVSSVELFLLGLVLDQAVSDLLPVADCWVTPDLGATPRALRESLTVRPRGYDLVGMRRTLAVLEERAESAEERARRAEHEYRKSQRLHYGSAVLKAGARLDVDPWVVNVAAERLWGRGLMSERDARVEDGEDMAARERQAKRGHVTRALLDELRPVVEQVESELRAKLAEDGA